MSRAPSPHTPSGSLLSLSQCSAASSHQQSLCEGLKMTGITEHPSSKSAFSSYLLKNPKALPVILFLPSTSYRFSPQVETSPVVRILEVGAQGRAPWFRLHLLDSTSLRRNGFSRVSVSAFAPHLGSFWGEEPGLSTAGLCYWGGSRSRVWVPWSWEEAFHLPIWCLSPCISCSRSWGLSTKPSEKPERQEAFC